VTYVPGVDGEGTTINRLSDRRVRTAKAGMHADGGGLYLRVTARASEVVNRYWLFRYSHRGTDKDRQLGIGPLDTVTLAAARATARECREQLMVGQDPVEQRKPQRAAQALADAKAMTFDPCRDAYIAAHRAGWRNVKHANQWTATLKTYVTPVFGHLPVGSIDTGLVLKVLEPIWTVKPETATSSLTFDLRPNGATSLRFQRKRKQPIPCPDDHVLNAVE